MSVRIHPEWSPYVVERELFKWFTYLPRILAAPPNGPAWIEFLSIVLP